MRISTLFTAIILGFIVSISVAQAGSVYVIGNGHGQVTNARNHLTGLGHTVTFSGSTLGDYSSYDQVWDLRYSSNLGASDVTAMGSYLASGGRMYMTGENSGFDSNRNNSLVSFLTSVGAGNLSLAGRGDGAETFTSSGESLLNNNPNNFASVGYDASRTTSSAGNGFLATEAGVGSGIGSLVGWDFGDIVGSSNARILVGFDIEIFQNGQVWTENMHTFLSAPANVVPEPATVALLGIGIVGLAGAEVRRRRKKKVVDNS